ncbi:hypothetical protein P7C70_g3195, partial [Phenoliferia sp. Uapishka_3]
MSVSTPRPKYLSPAPSATPLPYQHQRARSGGAPSTMSKAISAGLEDPVMESRRVIGLLIGVNGGAGEGLLGELEKGFENAFKRLASRDAAFDEDPPLNSDGPSLDSLVATLGTLLQILRTSPVGGYSEPADPLLASSGVSGQTMERSSIMAQKLFKERQRAKEGADIAGSVLASST